MHRINLLSVGKIKTPWIKDGCEVFIQRLHHQCDFQERVIAASSQAEENQKLADAIEKSEGVIVVLDELGKEFTSVDFSKWITKHRDVGTPITFVLGGAYGLTDQVRSKGDLVLSLSKMTLPHELCQLVFLEQLYRAHAISTGTGYHH